MRNSRTVPTFPLYQRDVKHRNSNILFLHSYRMILEEPINLALPVRWETNNKYFPLGLLYLMFIVKFISSLGLKNSIEVQPNFHKNFKSPSTNSSKLASVHTIYRFWCFPNLLGKKVNNSITRGLGQPSFVRGCIIGQSMAVCQMLDHSELILHGLWFLSLYKTIMYNGQVDSTVTWNF